MKTPRIFKSASLRKMSTCLGAWALGLTVAFATSLSYAAMPLAGTLLQNQAKVTYQPAGWSQTETVFSNTTQVQVQSVESLVLTGDAWVARAPGTRTTIPYRLVNQGNVTSTIANLVANATSCTGYTDTTDLANLSVIVDSNGNGIADPAEIAAGANARLQPGEAVSLLALADVPLINGGGACIRVDASSGTGVSASQKSVSTFVSVADNPVVQLSKSALYTKALVPGGTDTARYTINASNIGTRAATITSKSATGQDIFVDGVAKTVLLLRDPIPTGAQYKSASLTASHSGSLKLFRKAGDAPYTYSQAEGGTIVEVAVAYANNLEAGQSVNMQFDVTALTGAGPTLDNVAQLHFGNVAGISGATQIQSNEAQVPVAGQRLALAHWLVNTKVNYGNNGLPDNTVTYTLALRVRNDGNAPLYNLQLPQTLAGSSLFGNYTSATVPGTGEYTLVGGSLQISDRIDSGTTATPNSSFTGSTGQLDLITTTGSVIPVGGEFTLRYAVRVNVTHRANAVVQTQVTGQASLHSYSSTAEATDTSTNGTNPDPDADGNAGNNSVPTPITLVDADTLYQLAQGLKISKTASQPARVSSGVYDITYTLKVSNTSTVTAPAVRVIDNLACTFNTADSTLNVQSWSLTQKPVAAGATLPVSSAFTGGSGSSCASSYLNAADPSDLPVDPRFVVNDTSRSFAPGATETYTFTVRVTQANPGARSLVSNKAWFVSVPDNNLGTPATTASSATIASLLIDPQGYVYNSVTREAVSGALVTLTRVACDSGSVTPIQASEVFNSSSYTFNPDGSLSMVTDATGQYQFYWQSPPINNVCTYALSVTPPVGGGLKASTRIPAQSGAYAACSNVVPNDGIPTDGTTTWYSLLIHQPN